MTHIQKSYRVYTLNSSKDFYLLFENLTTYTAKTVVLTGVHRGPDQAFYTGVKFLVLAQHPVVLF